MYSVSEAATGEDMSTVLPVAVAVEVLLSVDAALSDSDSVPPAPSAVLLHPPSPTAAMALRA